MTSGIKLGTITDPRTDPNVEEKLTLSGSETLFGFDTGIGWFRASVAAVGGAGVAGVSSFNSRTGAVTPQSGDYQASKVANDSAVVGAAVKDALNSLKGHVDTVTGNPHSVTAAQVGAATTATKLDAFAAPDDNTNNDVTTGRHGLAPKLSGNAAEYLDGTGGYSTPAGSGGGVTDHGALTGLADDDHAQYHTDTRGDARYTGIAHASDTANPHGVTASQAGAAPAIRSVTGQFSITGGGNLTEDRTLSLVSDVTAPGNDKVYGTDGSGTRGWQDNTGAAIKAKYESESDTNAFTDAEQTKLADAKPANVLTQAEYDALTPDANTLYFITA